MSERKERRSKLFYVDPHFLTWILNGLPKHGQFVYLPVTDEIPEGAQVVSVNADWQRRAIVLEIEHETFAVVPDGAIPPRGTHFAICSFIRKDIRDEWQPVKEGASEQPNWRERPSML